MSMDFPLQTRIAGVSFRNDDGTSRQSLIEALSVGDDLVLMDTSSSKYPEAIGVFNELDQQLGYLPSDVSRQLHADNIPFEGLYCVVAYIGRADDSKPLGVSIILAFSEEEANQAMNRDRGNIIDIVIGKEDTTSYNWRHNNGSSSYKPNGSNSTSYHSTPYSTNTYSSGFEPPKKNDFPTGCLIAFAIIGAIIGLLIGFVSTH